MLVPIAVMLIRWRREGQVDRTVLGRYLVAVGVLRFLIEFVRVNVRVIAGLTVAHLASLCVIVVGVVLLSSGRRADRANAVG